MCGRITLTKPSALVDEFGIDNANALLPQWNIAPTQAVQVLLDASFALPHTLAARPPNVVVSMRWGLIPRWAKRPGTALINARAETVLAKPSFRDSIVRRRCLIPVDGFYEWQHTNGRRRPFHISPPAGASPIATFAGVWDTWRAPNEQVIHSFAILTVAAALPISELHDRMPLLVDPADRGAWLAPSLGKEAVITLLRPVPLSAWQIREVSTRVNRPQNDDPACLEPPTPQPDSKTATSGQGSLW